MTMEISPQRWSRSTFAIAVFLAGGLVGCSTFEEDWNAATTPRSVPIAGGLEGPWIGTWTSDVNGHTGGLRGIVSRRDDDHYTVAYHASYVCWGIFEWSFEYTLEMEAERDGESWRFQGEADLGWLAGGLYKYEGTVEDGVYRSRYEAESDRGLFVLERPQTVDGMVAPE